MHSATEQTEPVREFLPLVRTPFPLSFSLPPPPFASPFFSLLSSLTAPSLVGIVETMKLMNSVYAETSGTVAEIVLGDGEFAEQGAVLIFIDTQAAGAAP
ncbi:biotin/lipoyl-containing protein [Streptomyces sp. JV178]|uniref:biotin/lipoyl-containing protein n=1 Tax=Streptomyces sp. JV178 TaxID=858632 RepID=UPI000C1B55A4|nr:biotin/lipoyl-containing protein [Streptomyces sp. JV178]